MEALNTTVALRLWAPLFSHQLVLLFSDNVAAVSFFRLARAATPPYTSVQGIFGSHACTKWNISLPIGHVPGDQLKDTTDTLIHWHMGSVYRDRVPKLVLPSHSSYLPLIIQAPYPTQTVWCHLRILLRFMWTPPPTNSTGHLHFPPPPALPPFRIILLIDVILCVVR